MCAAFPYFVLDPLPLYRHTQAVAQQQQVEQLPQADSREQTARLAADIDATLFREMKAQAVLRGYQGYGKLIEDALRSFLSEPPRAA